LLTIDDLLFPGGSDETGCRLIDLVTGEAYHPLTDVITFDLTRAHSLRPDDSGRRAG